MATFLISGNSSTAGSKNYRGDHGNEAHAEKSLCNPAEK
jgi:hypothetical protein